MKRTQLNINIDPALLKKIKDAARLSGKSLASFVSDCFTKEVGAISEKTIDTRISIIEARLESIESTISAFVPANQKTTPFTSEEVQKCNEFIKAVFKRELRKKQYKSIKIAWNDLIGHIKCFDQWSDTYTMRLKETLFIDHGDPLSVDEMNLLTKGSKCPCPIRTGLINWINNSDEDTCCCSNKTFPSLQTICEKGSSLANDL